MGYKFRRIGLFLKNTDLYFPKILSKVVHLVLKTLKTKTRFVLTFYKNQPNVSQAASYYLGDYSDYAICLQGPCANPAFVEASINHYLTAFPGVRIYYGTNSSFSSDKVQIINAPYPEFGGFGNFNNQRQCSINALKQAVFDKRKYALKVRDDVLVRNPNALKYLMALSKIYASEKSMRVLFSSLHSRFHIPFHLCDFIQFGKSRELCAIWTATNSQNYTIDRKMYIEDLYLRTKVYDHDAKIIRPHVELGYGVMRHFLHQLPPRDFDLAWNNWMSLFVSHIGFFNLEDVGVFVDKYDTTLRYHRDFEDVIRHQVTTDLWLSVLESQASSGQVYPPFFGPNELY